MRFTKSLWISALLAGSLCLCALNPLSDNGGSGTRTGNPVVIGMAVDSSGSPATDALVRLRRSDYLSPIPGGLAKTTARVQSNTVTDSNGRFSIDSVQAGTYTIEINDQHGSAAAVRCTVLSTSTTVALGTHVLNRTCMVRGGIPPEQVAGKIWFVQIYGLERCAAAHLQTGIYSFSDVPAGQFAFRQVSTNTGVLPAVIDSVETVSGDTCTLLYPGWRLSKQAVLNTTPAGAGVTVDILNFPVLVRLTQSNFTFASAKADGADLRFMKPDGTPLPYEIEQWDSVTERAEVWVKADTVRGNSGTQRIIMLFGNRSASSTASGAAVFDTADGFRAVLHLNRNCSDATDGRNNGTNYGATDTAGMIGYSKKFHGTDSVKIAGLMGSPSSITLSAWTQLDTTDTSGAEVVSLGDDVLIREDDVNYTPLDGTGTRGSFRYNSDFSSYYTVSSGQFLQKTGWHYLVFTVDAASKFQLLYIDGSLTVSTYRNVSLYWHAGRNSYIGTHGYDWGSMAPNRDHNRYRFKGAIDEVRVCRLARSAEWIKLCFMNQRIDDKLVTVK